MNFVGCVLLTFASSVSVLLVVADHSHDHGDHGHTSTFCTKNATACMTAGLPNITCVTSKSDSCVKDVVDGKADLALAAADDIVKNAENLKIVAGEQLTGLDKFIRYYGLAVVKNNTPFTFNQLEGKKSCHTGVDKTVGWKIPVGYLLLNKQMKFATNQYVSADEFFGESCAPGIKEKDVSPAVKGDFCRLCNDTCTNTDAYSGYTGAFKCMAAGNNDRVGFVKQDTANEVFTKYPGKYGDASHYKLLCPDNSVKELSEYKQCNIGHRPASAIVTHKSKTAAMVTMYADMLTDASIIGKLRMAKIVNDDTAFLHEYTGSPEDYVGEYGKLFKALTPDSGASGVAVSIALQITSILALLHFVF